MTGIISELCRNVIPCALFLLLLSGVPTPSVAAAETHQEGILYETAFEGLANGELEKELRLLSNTVNRKGQPPPTLGLLRARVQRDIPGLVLALRSKGYYNASIEEAIHEGEFPVKVIFHVKAGNLYEIERVVIAYPKDDEALAAYVPTPSELGLTIPMPADARQILDAEEKLTALMKSLGYPFARVADTRVVVNHSTEKVSVTFPLSPGPSATFGPTEIQGLATVKESYVVGKIPWQQGNRYSEELLQEYRKRLTETRLFSLVRTGHGDQVEEDGSLPIAIEVSERKHRSVRAGIGYKTDEGVGAAASWEHRNFRGSGERLRTAIVVSQINQGIEGSFEKPDFLSTMQTLNANAGAGHKETDAYKSNYLDSSLLLSRDMGSGIKVSLGPGFRMSRVDDKSKTTQNFALVSFQGHLELDYSNDLLNPTQGGRLKVQLTPYMDTLDTGVTFLKSYVSYSHYLPILESPSLLFAGRAALGSITGISRDAIPSDTRFYAGGGGSIRGYPFQSVSPLDAENDPEGGRSLIEFSAELRWKITESLGMVTFLDGGGAFEPSYPDLDTSLRYGAGVGLRYYTPIGPLRVDVATPLNRRKDIDGYVQFYISIGQAF